MEFLFLLILITGGVAVWAVQLYNRLRTRSEAVKRAQSNLVGELKKRATLANQLIDIAKGYGDHEKLTHLTVASQTSTAADPAQIAYRSPTPRFRPTGDHERHRHPHRLLRRRGRRLQIARPPP